MTKLGVFFLLISCASAQRIQFDWDKLAAKATEKVDVTLEAPMLELASKFLGSSGEEADVKQIVQGLKGVVVKSFEFDKEGQYSEADVNAIRSQIRGPGWSHIFEVTGKTENAGVYIKSDGKQTQSIVILATEPKEFTVVEIIGSIDPSKLSSLTGKFGIPKMEIGPATKKGAPKKDD